METNKDTSNTHESNFMLFHQTKKRLEILKIEINIEQIESVEQFDSLGLILHKHVIGKIHVTN